MQKKGFCLLLALCLLCAAAHAGAIDIEACRVTPDDIRAVGYGADGGYTAALLTPLSPSGAHTPRHVLRYGPDGSLLSDVTLPDVEGSADGAGVNAIYRMPDGRDALFFFTGEGRRGETLLFWMDEAGRIEPGFALPRGTYAVFPFEGGVACLSLEEAAGERRCRLAVLDWDGRTRFRETRPEFRSAERIAAAAGDGERVFVDLLCFPNAVAVCADETGILWTHTFDGQSGEQEVPETLLPDGAGGLYAASGDATPPCEGRLYHLNAQGEIAFARGIRCDKGVFVSLLLADVNGTPTLYGAQTAHSRGYYRCFALTFDEESGALRTLEGRDFTTPLGYSYYLNLSQDRVFVGGDERQESDDGASRICILYRVPYDSLAPADDVNVWLE